jgi:peroxidase
MNYSSIAARALVGGLLLANCAAAAPIDSNSPSLLAEFRPIGATDNNLRNPSLDPVPNSPELNLVPLNFAAGTSNGLVSGPNPRTISNVISWG